MKIRVCVCLRAFRASFA